MAIEISSPAAGSTVSPNFVASGTSTDAITSAVLQLSVPKLPAPAPTTFNGTVDNTNLPNWTATFSNIPAGTGYSLLVSSASSQATQGNITVQATSADGGGA